MCETRLQDVKSTPMREGYAQYCPVGGMVVVLDIVFLGSTA